MVFDRTKQYVQEFHQRHGGECYPWDGFLWYADGAGREEDEPLGPLIEPPDSSTEKGQYELSERKLKFQKGKLHRALTAFDSLRETLTFLAPPDGDAALKKLEQLRDAVQMAQEELRQAQTALDQTSIGKRRKERREAVRQEQIKIEEFRAKMRAIRI